MRSVVRAALALTVFTGAWLATPQACAREDGSEFIGIFAPSEEIEPIFKITRNSGQLAVHIQQDDEACGWLPLTDADGKIEQARLAGQPELGKLLDRATSGRVQAMAMGSWGVIYHAPKGWRLNEDFRTRTGFFVTFTPASGGAPTPHDFRKVHLKSGCR
jgi:hypothetical protein